MISIFLQNGIKAKLDMGHINSLYWLNHVINYNMFSVYFHFQCDTKLLEERKMLHGFDVLLFQCQIFTVESFHA